MTGVSRDKRRLAAALVLTGLACGGMGCQKEPIFVPNAKELEGVKTVAVVPFKNAPGLGKEGSGEVVVDQTIVALMKFPRPPAGIRVVDRTRVDAIIKEHDLKLADLVDRSVVAKMGKLLEADALITGAVTQYGEDTQYTHMAVSGIGGGGTKTNYRVGISLRVIDVSNGEVIYGESAGGTSRDGYAQAAKAAVTEALEPLRLFYERRRSGERR